MIVDSEEHRKFLITVINSAVMQGPLVQVEKAVDLAREVREAVAKAKLAKPAEDKK